MAEAENVASGEDAGGGGWFGSLLTAAKSKGTEVFEFVRKDLEEFGSAVKSEATSVVQSTGSVIEKTLKLNEEDSTASTMKRSISSFIGQVNSALLPNLEDDDAEAILINGDLEAVPLTKLQKSVLELQTSDATYLSDPPESLGAQYQCWLEIVDDQLSEDRLTKQLLASSMLYAKYREHVPDKVCHQLFWKRYLFKRGLIEDEIARQELLERQREKADKQEKPLPLNEGGLKWDLDFSSSNVELSEEEQTRLLQEYENETRKSGKEQSKSTKSGESDSAAAVKKTESSNSLDAETHSSHSTDSEWEKISDPDK